MTGHEFLRKLRRLAKARRVAMAYDPGHGKGSHGRVSLGSAFTALKDPKQEIGVGLLRKMRHGPGIEASDH